MLHVSTVICIHFVEADKLSRVQSGSNSWNNYSLKMSVAGGSNNEDDYLLSCGVCFGKYDLLLMRPKILPCSHTFCFTCIQSLMGTESTLKCPMCRKTAVGVNKAESLPNNVHAEHNILLNKKLEQAEANSKISSKLLDAYFKSKKSECQVFAIINDHEPKVISFNASKDALFSFHETCMKIPDSEKPAKLRVISCEGLMWNIPPHIEAFFTALIKILKSQSPDVVFLYNVEPADLDRLRNSLPNFKLFYAFRDNHMSVTLLNTYVSYDCHEAVQLTLENSGCYDYLKVDVHMGSLKLKLINAEIDIYAEHTWREDLTKMMLNELTHGSDETANIIWGIGSCCDDQNWNMQQVMELPERTVDLWEACKKPEKCNYIWRDDEKTETDVLKYHDFNGESSDDPPNRLSRVYLRPATSVFAQPTFYGEIEFTDNAQFPHLAILVDFDFSSK